MSLSDDLLTCAAQGTCFLCPLRTKYKLLGSCTLKEKASGYIEKLEGAVNEIVRCKDCVFCTVKEDKWIGTTYRCRNSDGISGTVDAMDFCVHAIKLKEDNNVQNKQIQEPETT